MTLLVLLTTMCVGLAAWAASRGASISVNGARLADRALVQEGRPYLPLAAVRQIPGVTKVNWDGQQVRIETAAGRPVRAAYLSDMRPVSSNCNAHGGQSAKISGTVYPKSVAWTFGTSGDASWVEYDLSRKYKTFEAVIGLDDSNFYADATATFEVLGDGESLFRSELLGLGRSQRLEVPVAGVLRLRLSITGNDQTGTGAFGDARVR